jgi:hypothetical protein
MSKIKLSPAMKVAIKKMREGVRIYKYTGNPVPFICYSIGDQIISKSLHDDLFRKQLIQVDEFTTACNTYYSLTHLGKTIEL